ncbi:uncharacterized protein [Palaemon carinicauda]|uniref:uncharacterized protein n=1 Tax=Palaemon carinicauda TaxID=392227 RepID=UPI0035B5C35B
MKTLVLALMLLYTSIGGAWAGPAPRDENAGPFRAIRNLFVNSEGSISPSMLQNGESSHPRTFLDKFSNMLNTLFGRKETPSTVSCAAGNTTASDAETIGKSAVLTQEESSNMKIFRGGKLISTELIQNLVQKISENQEVNGIPMLDELILDIYGAACSEKNCSENAGICMNSIRPPGNMMKYHQQCIQDVLKVIKEDGNGKIDLAKCVMKAIFKDMNLTYTDNREENALTYLERRVVDNPALKGAGQAIYKSVANGTCLPPELDDFEVRREMKFHLCLIRICVEEMAKNT